MEFRGWRTGAAALLLWLALIAPAAASSGREPEDRVEAIETLVSQGRYGEASGQARALLEEIESEFGAESLESAAVLDVLVDALWRGGRFDAEVGAMAERALAIRERRLRPGHPDIATSLNTLGNFRLMTGDYTGARTCYERSLEIRETALPPDHPDIGTAHSNLALALYSLGEYAASKPHYERALAVREKVLGPDHPKVASTLEKLGTLLESEGDLDGAKSHYLRALEILERNQGPRHPDTITARLSMADLYSRIGNQELALDLLETNLEALLAVFGEENPDTAANLTSLGIVQWNLGRYDEAAESFRRAYRIYEKVLEPDHPRIAIGISNLAAVLMESGEYGQALPYLARALEIQRDTLGPDHPDVARTRLQLARARFLLGDLPAALQGVLESESILRNFFFRTVGSMTEQEAVLFKGTLADAMDDAMAILASLRPETSGGATARVWDRLVRSRAMVMDEIAARRRGGTDRAEERRRIGLQEVTRSLPVGSALVSFVRYHDTIFPGDPDYPKPEEIAKSGSARKGPRSISFYHALIFRQGETLPRVVPLGRGRPIAALVRDWSRQLRPPALPLAARQVEAQYRVAASKLREAVWDPVAPFVEDRDMVFLVPDGVIHLVSFGSLPTDPGKYLVETGPLLHYVAAERDLVRGKKQGERAHGILALGGPDFELEAERGTAAPGEDSCDPLASTRFAPLPAAGLEAKEVAALWKKAFSGDGETVHVLTGPGAGEERFRSLAPGKRVLHLATHAFRVDDPCIEADIGSERIPVTGLALAGANHRQGRPNSGDGILTSEEISSLDLDGVEWAVLSACDSGVGEVASGEGVLGLRRAFENAGVGTLILSLWYLDDHATRIWMRGLYRHRLEGKSTAEAMRAASLDRIRELRRKRRSTHPFYWGSFVATGDWR